MDGQSASQIPHLPSPLSQLSGGGGVFNESGHDGDGCVAAEEGNKEKGEDLDECTREGSSGDEMHEDPSVTETPDSLYPSPPVFEPPHIRNWFTSYVPETPTLDSLDDLKEYVPIESECAKDETVVEVSGKEREENFDELRKSSDCNEVGADENPCLNGLVRRKDSLSDACGNKALSENLDASQSSSFLSAVCETPELSESIGFPVDKKDFEEDDCANQCSNNEKVQSNGLPKSDICLGEDEQDKQSINEGNRAVGEEKLPTPETSCCEMKRSFEDWTQTNNGISPTKDIEKSSFNDGDTWCKKQENQDMAQQVGNGIPITPVSEQNVQGIPGTDWKLFRELPKFNIRNGDPSNVASILMKTTIGAYHWVPVDALHPEDAMEAMDAFILSHLAHLTVNRPANMTDAQLRKVAICLGVARAVSTTLFKLQPQDLMAGERTAPLLRASRNADGNLIYVIMQGIAAEQTALLNKQMVFSETERHAICQLVKCGAGILPMQGYSLIMTMHHYLSSADSQSRKMYQVAEKAYWYGQDVSTWFTTDIAIMQDTLWHKAGLPVRLDLKTRFAMDPSIGTILASAGAGACASRLPAVEPELRTANSYLKLVATVNPLFSMIGGNVNSGALAAMVEIVKAYPVIVTDVAVQPALPEDLVGIVVNRSTALSYLSSMLKRNQDIVAYCYGFYNAFSESSLMMEAGAGAQVDTLKTSYSLTKLKTQSHAAYTEGLQSYGDYSAVRNMRRQRGEVNGPAFKMA